MKIKQTVSLESVDRVYLGYLYNDAATLELGMDNDTINVTLTISQIKRLRDYLDSAIESHNKSQLEKARKALSEDAEV
jgi:hypothetical protein